MQKAPFISGFAILDVKSDRAALAKRIASGEKVRVRVDMTINAQASKDDGVSIEFSGNVSSVKQFKQPDTKAPGRARKVRR